MTAPESTGRCAMRAEPGGRSARLGVCLVAALVGAAAAAAADAPPPPPAAQAAHQVTQPEGLRGRLLRDEPSPVRSRDATIFTGISPVTAADPAILLPADQRIEPPAPEAGAVGKLRD